MLIDAAKSVVFGYSAYSNIVINYSKCFYLLNIQTKYRFYDSFDSPRQSNSHLLKNFFAFVITPKNTFLNRSS